MFAGLGVDMGEFGHILAIVGKDVQVLMCQTGQMGMVDVSRG